MWIGLMNSNKYNHRQSLRWDDDAITYNDRGQLHSFGDSIGKNELYPYGSGKWINFEVLLADSSGQLNVGQGEMIFDASFELNKINFPLNEMCFILELDAKNDEV